MENNMNTERWEIDSSHSSIHFSVRHLMIAKVRGQFTRWTGTLHVPDGDFRGRHSSRDRCIEHRHRRGGPRCALQSADFFDVEKYPEMTFTAAGIDTGSGERFALSGLLTIKGVDARCRPGCRGRAGRRIPGATTEPSSR